jgi:hypothetical protein
MESIKVPEKSYGGTVTITKTNNGIEFVHSGEVGVAYDFALSEWIPFGSNPYVVSLSVATVGGGERDIRVTTMGSSVLRKVYFSKSNAMLIYNFFKKIFDNFDTVGSKLDTLIDVFTMGPIALKLGTAHPDLRAAQERVNAALKPNSEGGSRTYRKKYHKEKKRTIKYRRSVASTKN